MIWSPAFHRCFDACGGAGMTHFRRVPRFAFRGAGLPLCRLAALPPCRLAASFLLPF